jgi:CRP/FNR family transcriptional regulator
VLKRSVVCFIKKPLVRELIKQNPELGLEFLQRASRTLGDAEEKFFENVTLSIRARLCHLLLIFKDHYGTTSENGEVSFDLPLSRQDLAALIGARPEAMSRIIKKIDDDGVVLFSGRTVKIPQIDRLADEL